MIPAATNCSALSARKRLFSPWHRPIKLPPTKVFDTVSLIRW
jgi:hypothetical protein